MQLFSVHNIDRTVQKLSQLKQLKRCHLGRRLSGSNLWSNCPLHLPSLKHVLLLLRITYIHTCPSIWLRVGVILSSFSFFLLHNYIWAIISYWLSVSSYTSGSGYPYDLQDNRKRTRSTQGFSNSPIVDASRSSSSSLSTRYDVVMIIQSRRGRALTKTAHVCMCVYICVCATSRLQF